jgi:hypothetical protein
MVGLLAGTVPSSKNLVDGTVLSSKNLVDGTVPSSKNLVDSTVLSSKNLVDGTVPSSNNLVDGTSKGGGRKEHECGGRGMRGWDGAGGGMGAEGELSPVSVGSRAGGDNKKRAHSAQRRVEPKD